MGRIACGITALVCIINLSMVENVSAAWGGGWTRGEGRLWTAATYSYLFADRKFSTGAGLGDDCSSCREGDVVRFSNASGGRLKSESLSLDAYLGLTDNLDLLLQAPFNRIRYEDANQILESVGLGDMRVGLKYGFDAGPVYLAFHSVVKAPTGEFDAEVATMIPLGEGQWDWEIGQHVGVGLGDGWANLSTAYKLRFRNRDTQEKPGDEISASLEYGRSLWLDSLKGKVAFDALVGDAKDLGGLPMGISRLGPRRLIVWGDAALFYTIAGGLTAQMGIRIPVIGIDYPKGNQILAGLWWDGAIW